MYIEFDSAARHLELEDAFGLPDVFDDEFPSVHGIYHIHDAPHFWLYDPKTSCWTVVEGGGETLLAIDPDLNADDQFELEHHLGGLNLLPRPAYPQNDGERTTGETFISSGWLFYWLFVPELKRWELATLGRM